MGHNWTSTYSPTVRNRAPGHLQVRLASSLRAVRKKRGLTQEEAAHAAGMHARHYQKLEEGTVNATIRTLERLCAALKVDIADLFGG